MEPAPPADPSAAADRAAPPRRRWLGAAIAVLALIGLGALAWYLTTRPALPAGGPFAAAAAGSAASGAPGPGGPTGGGGGRRGAGPSTVGIATATRADLPVVLDALGTVTPSVTVTVRPQVSGVLTSIAFTEGQMVKKGQLLATIDPRPFEITLQQAIGARMRDEAQLENGKVQLQRYQTLLGQDSIARQDVDTQAAAVKQLEGTIVIDRANENTARLNLGYTRIVAPVAGRIGLRPVDSGNYVTAGDATGVAVITQLNPIDVEFSVPQDRVPEIQASLAKGATLAVSAFDRTRTRKLDEGTFSTLDNQVDVQTGTVKAKARFVNAANALFPNQFVNVRLLMRSVEGAVVVPVTALRTGPNGDFVYVLNDDRTVSVRAVQRGVQTNDVIAVAKGLQAGERVVTEGGDRLRDGARVQLASERPGGGASGASGAFGGRRGASGASAAGSGSRRRQNAEGG
ncbi:MAG: efflux RND transporter periplasmic adaptor subunit [Burkholderiales bacterium]|nr:efflux RND transporter periplasmic adaptor subunit [Burkholderiales bacterium]